MDGEGLVMLNQSQHGLASRLPYFNSRVIEAKPESTQTASLLRACTAVCSLCLGGNRSYSNSCDPVRRCVLNLGTLLVREVPTA